MGHIAAPDLGGYCASKFGVVALSESLRQELQGSNISVSVLCPGWVATNIMQANRHRTEPTPVDEQRKAQLEDEISRGITPEEVAVQVIAAIRNQQFYIFTNPETKVAIQMRYQEIMESFS